MKIGSKKLPISLGSIQQYIMSFLIIIPASSFNFFRSILLLSFAFSMGLFFSKKGKINEIILFLLLIISFFTFSFLYSIIINHSFTDSNIAAFIRYVTFFSFLFLLILSYEHKLLTIKKITNALFLGLFTYNIIKIFLILLVPFGFFTARELMEFVSGFNIIIVPGFWTEDATFSRLSFGNDILNPFLLLFFIIINKKYRFYTDKVEGLFILTSFFAALFSFTRSIWIYELLVLFYKYIIIDKNFKLILLGIMIFSSIISYISIEYSFILRTFYTRLVDSPSLDMKVLQSRALIEQFFDATIFGSGIGAYVPDFIRSMSLKFIYEVQIYALLMQFGIIGFSLILIFFMWIIFSNGKVLINSYPIYIFYILWLLSGMTNPYLFILTSVFIYFSFYVLSKEKYNEKYLQRIHID